MSSAPSTDPLHGVTLEQLLTALVAEFGWEELGRQVPVRCFQFDPSIKSSLTFLRKTPWARAKVEAFYFDCHAEIDAADAQSPPLPDKNDGPE